MATYTYTIEGMTCGHCVKSVTEEVSGIKGVSNVVVDLDSKTLSVDAKQDPHAEIIEAVDEAGAYSVVE